MHQNAQSGSGNVLNGKSMVLRQVCGNKPSMTGLNAAFGTHEAKQPWKIE
jgi:hypothetical protein